MSKMMVSGRLVLATAVGFVAGVLVVAVHFSSQQQHDANAAFEQKIRCDQLAKQYERDNTDQFGSAEVDEVVFSPARNSCVAKVVITSRFWQYAVVDLLSREQGWSAMCNSQSDECANRGDELRKERDAHFKEFVSSR
jgi:hypothetical protein